VRIRSDDTVRLNTSTLFGPLFGTKANTKRLFGTSLTVRHFLELCKSILGSSFTGHKTDTGNLIYLRVHNIFTASTRLLRWREIS